MITLSKPRAILATYDRQALINGFLQLFYRSDSDGKGIPTLRPLMSWLPDLENHEIAEAFILMGRECGYSGLNTLGKIAFDSSPLSDSIKAFKWVAIRPDKLALLVAMNDILKDHGHVWPLAACILYDTQPPSYTLCKLTTKQIESHQTILDCLEQRPTTLDELAELVGKNCRDYILELRGLGHKVSIKAEYDRANKANQTILYLKR